MSGYQSLAGMRRSYIGFRFGRLTQAAPTFVLKNSGAITTNFLRQIDASTATFAVGWRGGLRLAIPSFGLLFRSPAGTPRTG
jgi:hypothetical protein